MMFKSHGIQFIISTITILATDGFIFFLNLIFCVTTTRMWYEKRTLSDLRHYLYKTKKENKLNKNVKKKISNLYKPIELII